ncbi:TIGR02444 family protein [Rheinheimera sp. 4Y26]|uniref:TIGR02444 family protein n=1 Tax=Rheinheimera sp. 4Y26 TaxID=2977811 RepID=UPI0021B0DE81|nr:TIGR02444 family protein [Rheinheimera sp. 4Y26]MCT6701268.1 TIGR02444 family protein [Rheinheimera sp. 4Y26]
MAVNHKTLPDAELFWQFSLALYPGIQPLCLQWQDSYGANVNLLLLLLYLQKQQLQCEPGDIRLLQQSLNAEQQFTLALRQLRRSLPAGLNAKAAEQMKQALLKAELSAEQLEQQQLIATLPQCRLSKVLPATNKVSLLTLYLQLLDVVLTDELQAQILDLDQQAMQLAFPTPKSLI